MKNTTIFKVQPTSSIPHRPGSLQCVRSCTKCIIRQTDPLESNYDELMNMKSYYNLLTSKSFWLSQYQSVQYHVGQIDILKRSIEIKQRIPTLYIIGLTKFSDAEYINHILKSVHLPMASIISGENDSENLIDTIKRKATVAIPVCLKSCISIGVTKSFTSYRCFNPDQLPGYLEPVLLKAKCESNFDVNIVPVVITKDHDRFVFPGLGSLCVRILEPYTLQEYTSQLVTSSKSSHLVQHFNYDIIRNAAVLSTNLVAFLILYLEREEGVRLDDLVKNIDWFRRISIDFDMQLGFTGSSLNAVQFALLILDKLVHLNENQVILASNHEALLEYASLIIPTIAYQGIISVAILNEYNRADRSAIQTHFVSGLRIKVRKDRVLDASYELAKIVEQRIPCCQPCQTTETKVNDSFYQMERFGHYFRVEEPSGVPFQRARWYDDYDSDDQEYLLKHQENPAFQTSIILTARVERIDRLNLFINSIDPILST